MVPGHGGWEAGDLTEVDGEVAVGDADSARASSGFAPQTVGVLCATADGAVPLVWSCGTVGGVVQLELNVVVTVRYYRATTGQQSSLEVDGIALRCLRVTRARNKNTRTNRGDEYHKQHKNEQSSFNHFRPVLFEVFGHLFQVCIFRLPDGRFVNLLPVSLPALLFYKGFLTQNVLKKNANF